MPVHHVKFLPPEMLMLNPFVKELVEALEKLESHYDWLLSGFARHDEPEELAQLMFVAEKALAPFKEGE